MPRVRKNIKDHPGVYSAAADWRSVAPPGAVLQMQHGSTTTQVSNSNSVRTDTGIAASITPYRATSKIVVQAQIQTRRPSGGNAGMGFDIRRNGVVVLNHAQNYFIYNGADVSGGLAVPLFYVDSPNSTSALEYRIYFASYSTSVADVQDDGAYPSYIILWEVAQ